MKKYQQLLMARGLPSKKRLEGVQHVLLVSSGKGGVGKSTVSVNLAAALAHLPARPRVSLLDADIFGPSVPTMLGLEESERPLTDSRGRLEPLVNHGISCMSIGFLVDSASAAVWRGPMVMNALTKLLSGTAWEADVLVVDLPPGTGDIHLSVAQTIHCSGAIVVSTPQRVALADVRRGVDMFGKVGVPVLGLVQNMAGYTCPACGEVTAVFGRDGAAGLARELQVPHLADIPLDVQLMASGDCGLPLVLSHPGSPVAAVYRHLATQLYTALIEKS